MAEKLYEAVPAELMLADGTPDYLRMILTSRVYEVVKETPVTSAVGLSARTGVSVVFKREDLQPVFSFKLRGAHNKIAHLPEAERWKGVVACSAGNHAQGVAYSAKHLGMPATIVMPTGTPEIKHQNVARMGSKVVLHGADFDAAKAECARLAAQHGMFNIPPFDDPYVIAGQGTVAMELLRQVDITALRAIFVAVGGGGLLAGVAAYVKRVAPHVQVVGVETYDGDALFRSLAAGRCVELDKVGLFSDGTAVRRVGDETFRLCAAHADGVVRVSTDEICAAIKDVFDDTRSIVEPSGALAVAGLKRYLADAPAPAAPGAYCAVLSGANINFDRLRFVAERARLGEGTEVFLMVTIPERAGAFQQLLACIFPLAVTEFSYRYSDAAAAQIYLSFSVRDRAQLPAVLGAIAAGGMTALDISDNELAKAHARYLVGGRAAVPNERLFSFQFPERPGALKHFLESMKTSWNITLFHYRNYGADIGQVLAAFAVPEAENAELDVFLATLGFAYVDETDNVVYRSFLRA
ncbi:tryptophan synthase beta subunit-like PLP-dependent enzyme [Dipodascopsis tothii]|uniref:tryptophan synthase beta subunit-like PLP-dependent enzyme n=1 Tax=Dipodascopsis tothii TaxID=44089 RepID=UPI0034CD75C4